MVFRNGNTACSHTCPCPGADPGDVDRPKRRGRPIVRGHHQCCGAVRRGEDPVERMRDFPGVTLDARRGLSEEPPVDRERAAPRTLPIDGRSCGRPARAAGSGELQAQETLRPDRWCAAGSGSATRVRHQFGNRSRGTRHAGIDRPLGRHVAPARAQRCDPPELLDGQRPVQKICDARIADPSGHASGPPTMTPRKYSAMSARHKGAAAAPDMAEPGRRSMQLMRQNGLGPDIDGVDPGIRTRTLIARVSSKDRHRPCQ